jgi:hypothetical protein
VSETTTPPIWPLALWEAAKEASGHRLPKLCPTCPDPNGLQVTVSGVGSFTVPLYENAAGLTIAVPVEGAESTVTWNPCGHTIRIAARLDEQPTA